MNLRTATDAELLNHLDDARHRSPVIGELCNRLEAPRPLDIVDANQHVECPVCEAVLTAGYDEDNNLFTLGRR